MAAPKLRGKRRKRVLAKVSALLAIFFSDYAPRYDKCWPQGKEDGND